MRAYRSLARRAKAYSGAFKKRDVSRLVRMGVRDATGVARVARKGIRTYRRTRGGKAKRGFASLRSMVAAVPAARATVLSANMPVKVVTDHKSGTVTMMGSQYLCNVGQWAGNGYVFGSFADNNKYNTIARIGVNPLCFGGRLAQTAILYTNYVFTKLRVRYMPTTSTTTTGNFTLAYAMDPNITYDATDATSKVLSVVPNQFSPYYMKSELQLRPKRPTDKKSFVVNSTDNLDLNAAYNDSIQGVLLGIGNVVAPVSASYGMLVVDYEIIFNTPAPPDETALSLTSGVAGQYYDFGAEMDGKTTFTVLANPSGDAVVVRDDHAVVGYGYDWVVTRPVAKTRRHSFVDIMMTRWKVVGTGLTYSAALTAAETYVPPLLTERAIAVGSWLPEVP